MTRPTPEAAVDLPARWIVGLVVAGCAASLATIRAGIGLYERLVGPLDHASAVEPEMPVTVFPFSPRSDP